MQEIEHIRGVVHVHTCYSHDGHLTPAQVAQMCMERGLSFAMLAEHAEDIDESVMSKLVEECEACSNEDFVLIPGVEHRFMKGIHLLALGQNKYMPKYSGFELYKQLIDDGCLLIAAHCYNNNNLPLEIAEMLNGLEVWNIARDTRYLPTSSGMQAYSHYVKHNPNLLAVGGLDMHYGREWGCELILDNLCNLSADTIISNIRQGDFTNCGRFVSFTSRLGMGAMEAILSKAGDTLVRIRNVRDFALAEPKVKR